MSHRHRALWIVLALAIAWVAGLASPADAAALRADAPGAADSWAPATGTLAVAPLTSSPSSRAAVAKHLGAGNPAVFAQPLLAIHPARLGLDGQAPGLFLDLICTPLRC